MEAMISRFRLKSSAFHRDDEEDKVSPKRIIFLSVEGDLTERCYFELLNKSLDDSQIQVEVLRHQRGEGYSDPTQVVELLNEYLMLREGEVVPEELKDAPLIQKYSQKFISQYLQDDDSLTEKERNQFKEDLLLLGIDIEYRKYLKTYTNDDDVFGIVIDRDSEGHSKELMENCITICESRGYGCYISNPCFEFWLLLHLCNLKSEFSENELERLLKNPKVSNTHTMASKEVSKRAGHNKRIGSAKFAQYYFPHIGDAIRQSNEFATKFPELINNLGTNVSELMQKIGFKLS